MRNHRIGRFWIASALLVTAMACDITTEPVSTVTDASIFTDRTAYRSYLAKLYGGLSLTGQQGPHGNGDFGRLDEGFSQYNRQLWQLQELPTDEAVIGSETANGPLPVSGGDDGHAGLVLLMYGGMAAVPVGGTFLLARARS